MMRLVNGLAIAALLGAAGMGTGTVAGASPPSGSERCTATDSWFMAHAGFEVAYFAASDSAATPRLNALADHIWEDCQFRLYDDNDEENDADNPEIPHVFSEDDYFLGGILYVYFHVELGPAFTRAEALAEMKTATDRFFWSPATVPDGSLDEIPVITGRYRDGLLPLGRAVGNHRYIIFPPGSHAPGEYNWRWEHSFPDGMTISRGSVTISPRD